MAHPNQRVERFLRQRDGGLAELEAELRDHPLDRPGAVQAWSSLPYVGKLLEIHAEEDPASGQLYTISTFEPAGLEEYRAWRKALQAHRVEQYGPLTAEDEAEAAAWELRQRDWAAGMPADATRFCVACQAERDANGG